jgi:hypothetical protein
MPAPTVVISPAASKVVILDCKDRAPLAMKVPLSPRTAAG